MAQLEFLMLQWQWIRKKMSENHCFLQLMAWEPAAGRFFPRSCCRFHLRQKNLLQSSYQQIACFFLRWLLKACQQRQYPLIPSTATKRIAL